MKEQQEKMLADLKAKKEAKENEEAEKLRKQEKRLAKAREQALKNFAEIPVPEIPKEESEQSTGQKKTKKFTDQNCLQAPDNDGDNASPSKKEVKKFVEPNLKAFMERNMPKL